MGLADELKAFPHPALVFLPIPALHEGGLVKLLTVIFVLEKLLH